MRRECRGRSSLMVMQLRKEERSTPLDCRNDGTREEGVVCVPVRTCV